MTGAQGLAWHSQLHPRTVSMSEQLQRLSGEGRHPVPGVHSTLICAELSHALPCLRCSSLCLSRTCRLSGLMQASVQSEGLTGSHDTSRLNLTGQRD